MTTLVNIDGALLPPGEAQIPVFDRGFLYGDSVYEVIRTYDAWPFALAEHLARLERSAARLAIPLPAREALADEIHRTLAAAGNAESYCRIIVTRGSGPLSLDPTVAEGTRQVILVLPFEPYPAWMYQRGVEVAIPSVRRTSRRDLDPSVKSGNYLNSVLALGEARRLGCDDAIMLDAAGRVTEATSANVFALIDGVLCTPALDAGLLEGVTRGLVMALAREGGLEVEERDLLPEDLERAEELMLTSTLREVLPVARLDGRAVSGGSPGPRAGWLRQRLQDYARERVAAERRRDAAPT